MIYLDLYTYTYTPTRLNSADLLLLGPKDHNKSSDPLFGLGTEEAYELGVLSITKPNSNC